MNEMSGLLDRELPGAGLVIWTLLIGLLVGLTYTVLKRLFLTNHRTGSEAKTWRVRLEFIERLYWPVLIGACLISLISSRPLLGVVVSAVLLTVFLGPLKNFILGVIYRGGNTYSLGQRIRFESENGAIRAFNNLGIELELEDGSMLDIPYSKFSESTILRSSPRTGVLSHSIELCIAKPCDIEREKTILRRMLLAMPYVLPDQKINFEHLSDEADHYLMRVIIHGIDKGQMYAVESRLKASYDNHRVSSRE